MSSLAISCGGGRHEQRSCRATAPSFVDAAHSPRIRASRRAAAAFSLGRQPEESVTRGNQLHSGDRECDHCLVICHSCSAAAPQLLVMTLSSESESESL
jgi:hypothetical protein